MEKFTPGSLIKLRNREWIVLPSNDSELILIKPLGGTDDEITGIFLPLKFKEDNPNIFSFPYPNENDLGNYESAWLMYNAARLSFRNVAGPFRCMGKLSFRPRSYQIVPLIMALKTEPIRLLIADDVGIGKTIEALIIVRELIDRAEIKSFAVVCLPHLCEQWQQELKDKFSIDAVIIRSSTAAKLERTIAGDESLFRKFPYQVISIDYIKTGNKRDIFLSESPNLIIIDEAHTCTKPAGANRNQQQRYSLVYALSQKKNKNLILLTATPHSGKQEEFQSLLGLLNSEYETVDLATASTEIRKKVAANLIIRRRGDIEKWNENTPFPHRDSKEVGYLLSNQYKNIFRDLLSFIRQLSSKEVTMDSKRKFRFFAMLSLLRGVMSSPWAGINMLKNKIANIENTDIDNEEYINPIVDTEEESDYYPNDMIEKTGLDAEHIKFLETIAIKLETVKDNKAEEAYKLLKKWLEEGFNTVVFCRFIETAKYLHNHLKGKFNDNIKIELVTGEMVDELRREKIDQLKEFDKKILIATDCLSEGINLQTHFTAVLHYDLPWNPNRLEQREGRVDRFGQTAETVKAYLLWGEDNQIDSVVLKILLNKAREIKRQTGISVPFPEDSSSIMESILNSFLLNPNAIRDEEQLPIDFADEDPYQKVTDAYEKAAERDKATRSIFSQQAIKVDEIKQDLEEVDNAIGTTNTVGEFVKKSLLKLGADIRPYKEGYKIDLTNVPNVIKDVFDYKTKLSICFISPTPSEFVYIGRNHKLVEQLSLLILNKSLNDNVLADMGARASVIVSDNVSKRTTIMLLRVRMIIEEKTTKTQLVAEEMVLWGFIGSIMSKEYLSHKECEKIIEEIKPITDISLTRQKVALNLEINNILDNNDILIKITEERTAHLLEANERFRNVMGGKRYQFAKPILPPDLLGVYIILPKE